jgi:hypothetical protein
MNLICTPPDIVSKHNPVFIDVKLALILTLEHRLRLSENRAWRRIMAVGEIKQEETGKTV